jgi:protein-L-isoaspartate(D-aspartate) O-methyltransferase
MVDGQIRTNKVTDPDIVDAMATVPREMFVPKQLRGVAYIDDDIRIAADRYLMEPLVLARLLQAAKIKPEDVVLDLGCGTGYSAAVLARLAAAVVALENDPGLANDATENLTELQADNVAVMIGKLPEGYPEQGPYDVVVINGAIEQVPPAIAEQISEGGRIVAVVDDGGVGRATVFTKQGSHLNQRVLFEAAVPPLPGFGKQRGFVF